MQKKIMKLISLMLVFCVMFTTTTSAFATAHNNNDGIFRFTDESGINYRIELFEKGNTVLAKQYENGILTCTNEMKKGGTIIKQVEDNKISYLDYSDKIKEIDVKIRTKSRNSYNKVGTMKYKVDGNKIDVYSKQGKVKQTTFEVKSYTGKVITFITIIAGALSLPMAIAEAFLTKLIYGLFVTVVGSTITSTFGVESLAAERTDTYWKVRDNNDPSNYETFKGSTYVINEYGHDSFEEEYYTGYVEDDYNTEPFRDDCHRLIIGTITASENIY